MSGQTLSESPTHGSPLNPPSLEAQEVLELLGDSYTQSILEALLEGPQSGRDLLELTDISKPTIYRRLNRLEEAGIVDVKLQLDQHGHHRKRYRLVVDSMRLEFDRSGVQLSVP